MSKKGKKITPEQMAERQKIKSKKRKVRTIVVLVIVAAVIACTVTAVILINQHNKAANQLYDTRWVPVSAKNASEDEVELAEVYNVKYTNYQGYLTFDKEGTFQLWMSPGSPEDGTHSGTFELDGDTIKANFDEGTKTEFYIQREDGLIKTIKLGYDEYTVYFGASANNNQ
jgi:hypothetical protein